MQRGCGVCSPLSPSSCPTHSLRDVRSCLARPAPPRRLIKLPARLFLFQLGERRQGRARRVASRCQTSRAVHAANMDAALHHRNQPSVPRRRSLALSFLFSFLISDAAEAPDTSRSQPRAKSRHAAHPCWADNNIWRQPLAALVGNDRLRFPGVSWGFLLCSWPGAFFLSSDLLTC
jgi:hypothetical protein